MQNGGDSNRGDDPYSNNYPLRGEKGDGYEGGVRAPTIYYDPRLPEKTKGTKRDFLSHVSDWFPTFLRIAGARNQGELR